ncbi:MAG TPA: arsenate reductase (glutaredoxin) [Gammaproteobacteria bacterium]|nr:arsenate reductase (glutaredoxin) [Gammaproteobacteria bacterium]
MTTTLYHNPRCSKSRATLALLRERGLEPDIIEYLQTPPTITQLAGILDMLGKRPQELLRKGEVEYKERIQGRSLSDQELLALMVQYPRLIERPIVIHGHRAAVGRPPEAVLDILG